MGSNVKKSIDPFINPVFEGGGQSNSAVGNDNGGTASAEVEDKILRFRSVLRFHLWAAFKWVDKGCTFHLIYCLVMVLQIMKVALITNQMIIFGQERANFTEVVNSGHFAIRHNLLKGWDTFQEQLPYPPTLGPFAVYNQIELKDYLNFAVNGFYNYPDVGLGNFSLPDINSKGMEVCIEYVENSPEGQKGNIGIKERCFNTTVTTSTYNIDTDLNDHNLQEDFKSFIHITMRFRLHTIRTDIEKKLARCMNIDGWIFFFDFDRDGRVNIDLRTLTTQKPCTDFGLDIPDSGLRVKLSQEIGATIVLLSLLSLIWSLFSLVLGVILIIKSQKYIRKFEYKVYFLKYVRLWDLAVAVGDIMTMYSTIIVAYSADTTWTVGDFDVYTIWLGVGCLLSWICLLRFSRVHLKFNLLFKTLARAMWNVAAYLFCAGILYLGYLFCGYVVLGPYHHKFQTLARTADTLFSLINADEIFFTIAALDERLTGYNPILFWFHRVYITSYVSIFTIVILNLLVAIFMTVYEEIRTYYKEQDIDEPPLNLAFRNYLKSKTLTQCPESSHLRQYLHQLCQSPWNLTAEEIALRDELLTATEGRKEFVTDPLKIFLRKREEEKDENDDIKILCRCCGTAISFFVPFKRCKRCKRSDAD